MKHAGPPSRSPPYAWSRGLLVPLLLAVLIAPDPAMAFDPIGPGVAKLTELYQKLGELEEKTAPLDPGDGAATPDPSPDGMPEVPVSCGENNDCWHCYKDANEKIEKLRGNFEKLRILYKETDDFTKAALAFGDGAAGATGLAALEWNAQRAKIVKSFKGFEAAYQKKYAELLEKLKAALQSVAECEKQYFGEDDWYARYGFMFHSFIALHYQR